MFDVKGEHFGNYKVKDLLLACNTNFHRYRNKFYTMNHINSEARDSLNGCTPFKLSQLLLNNRLHEVLHLEAIAPDDVTLCPQLLK